MTGDLLDRIQMGLDAGKSAYSIAREEGISEGSIRYAIKQDNQQAAKQLKELRNSLKK